MKITILFILTFFLTCNTYSNDMKKNPLANMFFIGAYNAPPEKKLTQKRVNDISNAGIDVIITGGSKKNILTLMKFADKTGLKVIPMNSSWIAAMQKSTNQNATAKIQKIIADYSNQSSLLAYGIYDEPAADLFPKLNISSKEFQKYDSIHPPLINLLPSYGSPVQLGASDFRAYISLFIKNVNPVVLSYDYYPFREGTTLFDGWHNDLRIVREESRKANIPFWVFVQSEGIKGGLKVPSREEIFWQANTALTYGARGILWFCYWTPPYFPKSRMHEKHYSAMIDIKGNKTPLYNYITEENNFLKAAGGNLADWDNKYIARYKNGKLIGGNSPVGTPKGKNFNLIIGTFTKNNNIRLVFSNDSFTKENTFSFLPEKQFQFVKVIKNFHSEFQKNNNFKLKPGGCIIIEFSTSSSNKKQGNKK